MTKEWQDFWVLLLLIAGYFLIVVTRILGILGKQASDDQKSFAGVTLLIFLVFVPGVFFYLGSFPHLWAALVKPFLR